MSVSDKPAATPAPSPVAALFLRHFWLASKAAVGLGCLIIVYTLFGLTATAYLFLGVALVACACGLYLLGRRLAPKLLKALRQPR